MTAKFGQVVFLMIQIVKVFLHVLKIVIPFYVQDHEFSPKKLINNEKRSNSELKDLC